MGPQGELTPEALQWGSPVSTLQGGAIAHVPGWGWGWDSNEEQHLSDKPSSLCSKDKSQDFRAEH